jgi:hypothetical protein
MTWYLLKHRNKVKFNFTAPYVTWLSIRDQLIVQNLIQGMKHFLIWRAVTSSCGALRTVSTAELHLHYNAPGGPV